MKKIIILVLTFLTFITVGCEFKQNKHSNEPIIYFEEFESNADNPMKSEFIYQDSKYKYFLDSYKKTYIEYKGKQYSYYEALDKNLVTINDLINHGVQIYQRVCNNYQISDELRIYAEEYPPYEYIFVTSTIYQDSQYNYTTGPYKEDYVEYQGQRYTYSEALNKKIITLNDLVKAGVKIIRKELKNGGKVEEYTGE